MKKWIESSIAIVCLAAFAACSGGGGGGVKSTPENSNSVVGQWKFQETKTEAGGKIETTLVLDLKADKTMAMNMEAVMDGEQKGIKLRIPMKMGFDGKWDASADKMIWIPDTTSSHFSIDKDSIVISLPNPKLDAMVNIVKNALVDELQKSKKTSMMLRFAPQDSMTYFFDNAQLVLVSDKDTLRFKK